MTRPHLLASLAAAALMAATWPSPARSHAGCHTSACHKRVTVKPHRAFFERVARCESGGRWHLNTGNGHYGGLQFTRASWWAVGGTGLAHEHGRLEQMFRGVLLLRVQGRGAWPVCGR